MKFEKVESVNKIENNLFVKHKVEDIEEGVLIQKCVHCGEIIKDYTHSFNSKGNTFYPDGYLYICKSGNTESVITDSAIQLNICTMPKEIINCTAVYS